MSINLHLTNQDHQLSPEDIARVEAAIGLRFPSEMRSFLLHTNGGVPEECLYLRDEHELVVSEFLPLVSGRNRTSVSCYENLRQKYSAFPTKMYPFAREPSGDYFVVDCETPGACVFVFRHETGLAGNFTELGVQLGDFLSALVPETS